MGMAKSINELFEHVPMWLMVNGEPGMRITHLTHESRTVIPGSLFFALPGRHTNGVMYALNAIGKGAVAVVTEVELPDKIPQIVVKSVRAVMSLVAKAFYDNACDDLKIIGITGTNGKTTTLHMLSHVLRSNNLSVATIGTLGAYIGTEKLYYQLTTPDPIELHSLFHQMRSRSIKFVIMEATAHAIYLEKLEGVTFELGIFTNISQDHLDFFPNYETYAMTKVNWLGKLKNKIVNIDDRYGKLVGGDCIKYGLETENADIAAVRPNLMATHSFFSVADGKKIWNGWRCPVPGRFNLYNALATISASRFLGVGSLAIKKALKTLPPVPGRFNIIDVGGLTVVIDFAHTPDSLEKIIETCREMIQGEGKIYTVFGCGGDRDKSKREKMGSISAVLSDFTIVTSDNPRTENPQLIMLQIEAGIKICNSNYKLIECRRSAIFHALEHAKKNDIVIIAGKGAEEYQEINGKKEPFCDREVVESYKSAQTRTRGSACKR